MGKMTGELETSLKLSTTILEVETLVSSMFVILYLYITKNANLFKLGN